MTANQTGFRILFDMENYEMDLFERTKAAFRHGRAEYLNRGLTNCSLFLDLASKSDEQGDMASAVRAIACAEDSYATVLSLLSDSQCVKYLTIKEVQELTKEMRALRKTLDGIIQFSE